jgi:hypothetical protein
VFIAEFEAAKQDILLKKSEMSAEQQAKYQGQIDKLEKTFEYLELHRVSACAATAVTGRDACSAAKWFGPSNRFRIVSHHTTAVLTQERKPQVVLEGLCLLLCSGWLGCFVPKELSMAPQSEDAFTVQHP